MEEKQLQFLKDQKQSGYAFKDVNKFELVLDLLEDIGIKDPQIRDELVYPALAHLLHDKHLTEDELTAVLDKLIGPEYLLFDLDNIIEYSVLIRSFTVLQLVILVHVHNRDHIIPVKYIKQLSTAFMSYFQQETILDGYNETVGFMHSIAHSADLFAQLFKVEDFNETIFKSMLNAIQNKFKINHYYFSHDEDERMVVAIMNALDANILEEEYWKSWISQLGSYTKPTTYPAAYYIKNNVRNILRSLYFALHGREQHQALREHIEATLKEHVTLR
ncbi:DUF2785 domain-containing protein [Candidatus Xianfuyuplasma coldseepsis]|uniref:DUF2785 domain-containing protein n=1 Tax=Candidatus Xianfuyuplasma coldseepsis TaxID=2782163 RepID=A0A7L7KTK3_9MOLU|nr:DUF2785 domain-containing protein [Xianfuyuplasma coldseepsis]QMS85576.1 DUF2785 domain-containing protein [Xianfuyuplasma coldseepsis]